MWGRAEAQYGTRRAQRRGGSHACVGCARGLAWVCTIGLLGGENEVPRVASRGNMLYLAVRTSAEEEEEEREEERK